MHAQRGDLPRIFHVGDMGAEVRPGADFVKHDAGIRTTAAGCPVEVIKFEEKP